MKPLRSDTVLLSYPLVLPSAPEFFQCPMSAMLQGLKGAVCMMEDVLIFDKNHKEHDDHLEAVLKQLIAAGVTPNPEKCEFSKSELKFLGHIINHQGVTADPAKKKAILEMKPPKNVSELRNFAGMTNQLSKFIPCSAYLMPLTELLSSKRTYLWGPSQIQAFAKVKEVLTNTPLLALYDPISDTKVLADAWFGGCDSAKISKQPRVATHFFCITYYDRY